MQNHQAQPSAVQVGKYAGTVDLKKNGLWGWVITCSDEPERHSEQLFLSKERAEEALHLALDGLDTN